MQKTEIIYLEQYEYYLKFLEKCKYKNYNQELVLHKHHIIPTFIHTDETYNKHTVLLSVEDHIEAHLLLSRCFEEGSYEQIGNLRAVKLLSKSSIRYKNELLKIYKAQQGDSNPAKLNENKIKISKGLKNYYKKNNNPKKGKSYEEIYGKGAEQERKKRKKCTRTPEEYKASAAKTSKKLKGRLPHNAQGVVFQGKSYNSLTQAFKETGVSIYKIKQILKHENKGN